MDDIRFLKGHGTENDFVLLPDGDGVQGPPSPELVRALCDRHAGIGADGVIRVVRTHATDDPAAVAWQLLGMIDGLNAQALVRWGVAAERGSLIAHAVEGMLRLPRGALVDA